MAETDDTESPVETLRRSIREIGLLERKEQREKQLNSRRGILGEVLDTQKVFKPEDVRILAEKLKCRHQFTGTDYIQLSQALIQSEDNIISFMKASGAVQSLVRDLIGNNASHQLAAANCCCNLALGNEKSCLVLTKAAAPYLILNLDGLNSHLAEMSVWTLGNLAGSHSKSWLILQSQGFLPKVLHLLTSTNVNVKQSAIYALTHYVRTGVDNNHLKPDLLVSIAIQVHPLMEVEPSVLWLMHLISCFEACDEVFLKNSVVTRSVNLLVQTISDSHVDADAKKTTALVRILGNLCAGQGAFQLLSLETTAVCSVLKTLLSSQYLHIKRETLWLIGNLFNHTLEEIKNLAQTNNLEFNLEPVLSETIATISR